MKKNGIILSLFIYFLVATLFIISLVATLFVALKWLKECSIVSLERCDLYLTEFYILAVIIFVLSILYLAFSKDFSGRLKRIFNQNYKEILTGLEVEEPFLKNLLRDLEFSAKKHRRLGVLLTTTLIVLLISLTCLINFKFIPEHAKEIKCLIIKDRNPFSLVVYYLGRAIVFGSFFGTSSYFIFKLAKSSFDQSVRYRRRLNGVLYTHYILKSDKISTTDLKVKDVKDLVLLSEMFKSSEETAFSEKSKQNVKNLFSVNGGENFKASAQSESNTE